MTTTPEPRPWWEQHIDHAILIGDRGPVAHFDLATDGTWSTRFPDHVTPNPEPTGLAADAVKGAALPDNMPEIQAGLNRALANLRMAKVGGQFFPGAAAIVRTPGLMDAAYQAAMEADMEEARNQAAIRAHYGAATVPLAMLAGAAPSLVDQVKADLENAMDQVAASDWGRVTDPPPHDPYRSEEERVWPLADVSTGPDVEACGSTCLEGECGGGRMPWSCGGCCGCLGGCRLEYERQQCAPFVWPGDQA